VLTLTENAATVVKTIANQDPDATGSGLRIAATDIGSSELNLTIADAPEPVDTVVSTDGALVFLEPTASELLEDKVLDARVEENGSVSFALGVQADSVETESPLA
jgi:iron-sulfur cluster assembly protein